MDSASIESMKSHNAKVNNVCTCGSKCLAVISPNVIHVKVLVWLFAVRSGLFLDFTRVSLTQCSICCTRHTLFPSLGHKVDREFQ